MTPEAFETALIEKVNALNIVAVAYPENPKNYYPENSPGEVLVRYEGRKVLDIDTAGQCIRVKLFGELVVVSRQLRGENGAYSWLNQIFRSLEGFTLDGASGALHIEVESFMDENEGTWQFGQKWSCESLEFIEITDSYGNDNLGAD
jgi:hypothetical protein